MIETLDEQHPELAFGEPAEKRIALFETMIHPKTRRTRRKTSPCFRCRQAGLKIWANTASKLTHTGTQNFRGDFASQMEFVPAPEEGRNGSYPPRFSSHTRDDPCIRAESDH